MISSSLHVWFCRPILLAWVNYFLNSFLMSMLSTSFAVLVMRLASLTFSRFIRILLILRAIRALDVTWSRPIQRRLRSKRCVRLRFIFVKSTFLVQEWNVTSCWRVRWHFSRWFLSTSSMLIFRLGLLLLALLYFMQFKSWWLRTSLETRIHHWISIGKVLSLIHEWWFRLILLMIKT